MNNVRNNEAVKREAEMQSKATIQQFNNKLFFEKAQNPNIQFNQEEINFLKGLTQLYTRSVNVPKANTKESFARSLYAEKNQNRKHR
jgi:hypothetical protein